MTNIVDSKKDLTVWRIVAVGLFVLAVGGGLAFMFRNRDATSEERESVKTETQEAAEAMRNYAYAQRAEFVENMKKDLAAIQDELDMLSAQADRARGAAKVEANRKLEAVRERLAQANLQLDQVKDAGETNWNETTNRFKQSREDLKESFASARQWLSDKIEP